MNMNINMGLNKIRETAKHFLLKYGNILNVYLLTIIKLDQIPVSYTSSHNLNTFSLQT